MYEYTICGFVQLTCLPALTLSLVHTVPVYAPVRSGSLQPADRGEPGRIGEEFDCVHIFPAVLPGPGPAWGTN